MWHVTQIFINIKSRSSLCLFTVCTFPMSWEKCWAIKEDNATSTRIRSISIYPVTCLKKRHTHTFELWLLYCKSEFQTPCTSIYIAGYTGTDTCVRVVFTKVAILKRATRQCGKKDNKTSVWKLNLHLRRKCPDMTGFPQDSGRQQILFIV